MNSWFKIQYLGLSRHSAIFFSWWLFFHQPLRWNHRQDLKRLVSAKLPEPSVSLRCGGKGGGTDLKRKGLDRFEGTFILRFFVWGPERKKTFRSSWWPSKELNFIVNSQLFCMIYNTCDVSLGVHSRLRWMKMEGNSENLKGKSHEIRSLTRRKERWQRRVKRQGGLGRREKGRPRGYGSEVQFPFVTTEFGMLIHLYLIWLASFRAVTLK